ncbi:MAG: hypothetical protein KDB10_15340, partial [Acidimicrobiales bacterium]|nr:hypothetical protein [Acidimicrobiales bacterium]
MTRPSPTPTGRPTTRGGLAAVVAAVALALVAGLFLAPVGAQSEDDAPAGPRRLTDEQRQC